MARGARRRLGAQSINRLIPNSLALLAPCADIAAMRFVIEGQRVRAVIAIVVAAVLDGQGENDEPEDSEPENGENEDEPALPIACPGCWLRRLLRGMGQPASRPWLTAVVWGYWLLTSMPGRDVHSLPARTGRAGRRILSARRSAGARRVIPFTAHNSSLLVELFYSLFGFEFRS